MFILIWPLKQANRGLQWIIATEFNCISQCPGCFRHFDYIFVYCADWWHLLHSLRHGQSSSPPPHCTCSCGKASDICFQHPLGTLKSPYLLPVDSGGFSLCLHECWYVPVIGVELWVNCLFLNSKTLQLSDPVSHSISVVCLDHRAAYLLLDFNYVFYFCAFLLCPSLCN